MSTKKAPDSGEEVRGAAASGIPYRESLSLLLVGAANMRASLAGAGARVQCEN